jgi:S-adenosylmethionine:diacylglycerol 3-amino-3-carboxypropyl transferase
MKKLFLLIAALVFVGAACSSTSEGNFQIYMKDAPALYDKILVNITQITVHKTGGAAFSVSQESRTIDLIQLQGRQEFITERHLEPGKYTEIRLITSSGQVVIGGKTYDMEIPSTEIKIPVQFDIINDQTTKIILDFNADASIEVHATGDGSNKYILRPVIIVDSIVY